MYGFDFVGHPNLIHLYLPGQFEGFPLRKDFPLLAREVKPWPGLVDVEPFPESAEAEAEAEEG
jgi:NADH-quinone oxidoreductase subunit C